MTGKVRPEEGRFLGADDDSESSGDEGGAFSKHVSKRAPAGFACEELNRHRKLAIILLVAFVVFAAATVMSPSNTAQISKVQHGASTTSRGGTVYTVQKPDNSGPREFEASAPTNEDDASVDAEEAAIALAAAQAGADVEGEPAPTSPALQELDLTPNATLTAAAEVHYPLHTLPEQVPETISENGVICMYRKYGRLNNQILSVRGGLVFAYLLNRTLVVPRIVSSLFDANLLGHIHPKIAVAYNGNICKKARTSKVVTKLCKHRLGCKLLESSVLDQLKKATAGIKVLGLYGDTMFRNARWAADVPGLNIERGFYEYLYPRQSIRDTATKYIEENFQGKEFAAVHLRWLEGSCFYRMKIYNNGIGKMLCSPSKPVFLEVMHDTIGFTDMPIFVASDRQRLGALESYNDGNGYLYKGPCSGYECAVIDFEIAARANFFIGVIVSTASDTISKLREHRMLRDVGRQFPSVLSWSRNKTELELYKGGYYKL